MAGSKFEVRNFEVLISAFQNRYEKKSAKVVKELMLNKPLVLSSEGLADLYLNPILLGISSPPLHRRHPVHTGSVVFRPKWHSSESR